MVRLALASARKARRDGHTDMKTSLLFLWNEAYSSPATRTRWVHCSHARSMAKGVRLKSDAATASAGVNRRGVPIWAALSCTSALRAP
ncbi:hypothetical protein D3C87_1937800 [compost metagenome]